MDSSACHRMGLACISQARVLPEGVDIKKGGNNKARPHPGWALTKRVDITM